MISTLQSVARSSIKGTSKPSTQSVQKLVINAAVVFSLFGWGISLFSTEKMMAS